MYMYIQSLYMYQIVNDITQNTMMWSTCTCTSRQTQYMYIVQDYFSMLYSVYM